VKEADLPTLQPLFQKRIWDRFKPGDGPEKLEKVIAELKQEDGRFHMEGGSWTNDISWVQGYDNVLGPMEKAQRSLLREDPETRHCAQRSTLSECAVSPDEFANQLLPVLGTGVCGPTTVVKSAGGPRISLKPIF
jgi:hypothetical protein